MTDRRYEPPPKRSPFKRGVKPKPRSVQRTKTPRSAPAAGTNKQVFKLKPKPRKRVL